jgi:hypothetical protein
MAKRLVKDDRMPSAGVSHAGLSTGDVVAFEDGAVVEYESRIRPLLHVGAPLVTAAAIWIARQGVNRAYERATGRTPPTPKDPRTSWGTAILWTAATASTAAVIELAVHRLGNERFVRVLRRQRDTSARLTHGTAR